MSIHEKAFYGNVDKSVDNVLRAAEELENRHLRVDVQQAEYILNLTTVLLSEINYLQDDYTEE